MRSSKNIQVEEDSREVGASSLQKSWRQWQFLVRLMPLKIQIRRKLMSGWDTVQQFLVFLILADLLNPARGAVSWRHAWERPSQTPTLVSHHTAINDAVPGRARSLFRSQSALLVPDFSDFVPQTEAQQLIWAWHTSSNTTNTTPT